MRKFCNELKFIAYKVNGQLSLNGEKIIAPTWAANSTVSEMLGIGHIFKAKADSGRVFLRNIPNRIFK